MDMHKSFGKRALSIFLVLLLSFLVLGASACEKEVEAGIPGPPEQNAVDFEKLPQLNVESVEGEAVLNVYEPACLEVLKSGDSEDKIDVVFVAEQYNDLEKFKEDVQRYIDEEGEKGGIFGVEPFKSNKGKFNFYMVNSVADLSCELGCYGLDRLVCCDDAAVKTFAAQCPHDQILILVDIKKFCGASKDYATVCTIDDPRAGLVLVHEMGHTLGGLGDEYDYGTTGSTDVPNCDDSPNCEKWEGVEGTGCFEGCGYANLYRPTRRDSLMNVYIPKFGPVSNQAFLDVLENYETSQPISLENLAAPIIERSYVVNLKYIFGEVELDRLFVTNTTFEEPLSGEYVGRVKSFDDNVLAEFKLDLPTKWYSFYPPNATEEGKDRRELVEPSAFVYSFNAPYFYDGALLEIYASEGKKVDDIDLSRFAEVCGDGVCQERENYLECSKDCPINRRDEVCLPYTDGVCDPDCPKYGGLFDRDCVENVFYSVAGLLIVLVIAFFVIFYQKMYEEARI